MSKICSLLFYFLLICFICFLLPSRTLIHDTVRYNIDSYFFNTNIYMHADQCSFTAWSKHAHPTFWKTFQNTISRNIRIWNTHCSSFSIFRLLDFTYSLKSQFVTLHGTALLHRLHRTTLLTKDRLESGEAYTLNGWVIWTTLAKPWLVILIQKRTVRHARMFTPIPEIFIFKILLIISLSVS